MNQLPDLHGPSYRLPSPPPPDPTGWHELRRKARATLWPPRPVAWAALLALAVAAAGLWGLWFQATLPGRLPTTTDWKAVAAVLSREARPGDAVVLFPPWAERGRELLPDRIPTRPDVALPVLAFPSYAAEAEDLPGVRRVWLVAVHGAPRLRGTIPAELALRSERVGPPLRAGGLDLVLHELRSPVLPNWSLADAVRAAKVAPPGAPVSRQTREVNRIPRGCAFLALDGPAPGPVSLRFPAVPIGSSLRGHVGLVGDVAGGAPPVSLRVKVDGVEVGRAEAAPSRPWSAVRVDTSRLSGRTSEVEVEVVPAGPLPQGACVDLVVLP